MLFPICLLDATNLLIFCNVCNSQKVKLYLSIQLFIIYDCFRPLESLECAISTIVSIFDSLTY